LFSSPAVIVVSSPAGHDLTWQGFFPPSFLTAKLLVSSLMLPLLTGGGFGGALLFLVLMWCFFRWRWWFWLDCGGWVWSWCWWWVSSFWFW
jgi:hypothetical protein